MEFETVLTGSEGDRLLFVEFATERLLFIIVGYEIPTMESAVGLVGFAFVGEFLLYFEDGVVVLD